jgi:hypothetical protein
MVTTGDPRASLYAKTIDALSSAGIAQIKVLSVDAPQGSASVYVDAAENAPATVVALVRALGAAAVLTHELPDEDERETGGGEPSLQAGDGGTEEDAPVFLVYSPSSGWTSIIVARLSVDEGEVAEEQDAGRSLDQLLDALEQVADCLAAEVDMASHGKIGNMGLVIRDRLSRDFPKCAATLGELEASGLSWQLRRHLEKLADGLFLTLRKRHQQYLFEQRLEIAKEVYEALGLRGDYRGITETRPLVYQFLKQRDPDCVTRDNTGEIARAVHDLMMTT